MGRQGQRRPSQREAVLEVRVPRGGGAALISCGHCGHGLAASDVVEAWVRGASYLYCAQGCAEAHADAVEGWSGWCGVCGDDAYGDTGLCEVHVEGDDLVIRLPLAG